MTRGGLNLTMGGNFEIFSVYELLDSRVEVPIAGQMSVLESPWRIDDLSESLPPMEDAFCTSISPPGRINPFEANRETLLTIPGLPQNAIEAILTRQAILPEGDTPFECSPLEATPAWLLAQGFVDLPLMRRLDHYMTGGGAVFRCQILGIVGKCGPMSRLELLIDAAKNPPRFLEYTDLSELGSGYPTTWQTDR